jgi:ribosomal protein L11 methyltransferase
MTGPFIAITFSNLTAEQSDRLIAVLSEEGFEGFEEQEQTLLAYIAATSFDADRLAAVAEKERCSYVVSVVEATNWNQEWESNFSPVTIDSFLHIRADFHPVYGLTQHEIVITPKMSFGTGHHATTRLMVSEMSHLDLVDKAVFDFGTGTGVLAILAEKLGAQAVLAIDNDDWSLQNALENIQANQCSRIQLFAGDAPVLGDKMDVILANINLTILCEHMRGLVGMLKPEGQMLLSGILEQDRAALLAVCEQAGLRCLDSKQFAGWCLLRMAY